jgi:hypothetical protein
LLKDAAPLTGYAVELRYPGETEEPGASEIETAVDVARVVLATVTSIVSPADQKG